jgi:hypothetical protein
VVVIGIWSQYNRTLNRKILIGVLVVLNIVDYLFRQFFLSNKCKAYYDDAGDELVIVVVRHVK